MIDYRQIKEFSTKSQTSEENIIREYLQSLFLKWFYRQENSENFLFKGGTALRLVYQSLIERDLKYLLPVSFHPVIKNFPQRLMKELR